MLHIQHVNNTSSTFSAVGTRSSLVITVPQHEFNITYAFKVILAGDWILNIYNGTVTNFEANFLASPIDGSLGHIYQITNFSVNKKIKDDKNMIIQSTNIAGNNNSLLINELLILK